ncbi:LacI family DNA-binding transcriptional regulator [Streptomyces sp. cg28]|uniref:LacI family DNA-binding transcriptional regulator n=1 Tax=unclassified Streptomyces TaxID=2593676 RepID=UPI000DBAC083|nr:LacI family DNA-binding transcriptional regulator [Streptomyces sp. PsTaAH-137]MYT70743.1 substrate-binding domain-containing protein [Streptomyces sp. SID8367]RAJ90448.1 LacI family transcriptional regulator [Streptomyces sp. PsTaAH-137]
MGEKVTIRDVAARAGVSVATVSRVLAGSYPTSAASRAKVLRAAKDLDYVANAHARALAGAGRKTIAVLMLDVVSSFYAAVAQGVEMEAARHDRLTLVASTGADPARELALVQMMREQAAEAVVLVGGVVEDDEYRERMARYAQSLAAAGSRLVLCGRPAPAPDVPALVVEYDNEAGAHAITSHLLGAGHRRIALIGYQPGNTTGEDRVRGYLRALEDHGVPRSEALLHGVGFGRFHGDEAIRDLLRKCDGKPDFTAVFAGDDRVAAAAIRALAEYGLRVPEDISVVGYNDDPVAADITPALTTVHIPGEELGRTAVRLALDGAGRTSQQRHLLGTHIVVRESVGRVRP